jgi:hypothetical protein
MYTAVTYITKSQKIFRGIIGLIPIIVMDMEILGRAANSTGSSIPHQDFFTKVFPFPQSILVPKSNCSAVHCTEKCCSFSCMHTPHAQYPTGISCGISSAGQFGVSCKALQGELDIFYSPHPWLIWAWNSDEDGGVYIEQDWTGWCTRHGRGA